MNVPDALPTLRTERLVIRAIGPGDVPALFDIFSDPEVTRYWSSPPLPDLAAAHELADSIGEGLRTQSLFQWGVTLAGEDRVIGTCTLASISRQHRRAEVGFAVGRWAWGRGVATEAAARVVRHGFEELGLHRVEADVDPRNTASLRILERLGFQREGYLRERYLLNDEEQDAVLYGLLRREWSGLRGESP